MQIEFLVRYAVWTRQKMNVVKANYRQRLFGLFGTDFRVALTSAVRFPEILRTGSTIGSEYHDGIAHALKQDSTADRFIIRMSDEHQGASEEWVERIHRKSDASSR